MFQCRRDGELSAGRKVFTAVRVPHPAAAEWVEFLPLCGISVFRTARNKEEVFLCPFLKRRFQKPTGTNR